MTRFLSVDARYDGFDVVAPAIRWCRRNITREHPNFRFVHADLASEVYNPLGRYRAAEYTFPYGDGSYDLVFATSVFSHLLPGAALRFLTETARVLKPGGRFLGTFFVLDQEARALVSRPNAAFPFRYPAGGALTIDPRMPESAVGYPEDRLLALLDRAGLALAAPVRYGEWSGRPDGEWGQDTVLAVRRR